MDLYTLGTRIQNEDGQLLDAKVVVLGSDGIEHEILSLDWDHLESRWILVTKLR
jgi:hypothetical protein